MGAHVAGPFPLQRSFFAVAVRRLRRLSATKANEADPHALFDPVSPQRVWAVLAGFDRYAEWHPLNIRAEGEAEARRTRQDALRGCGGGRQGQGHCPNGRRGRMRAGRASRLDRSHSAAVLGRHFFEPVSEGTALIHGEDLSGLIRLTFSAARVDRQRSGLRSVQPGPHRADGDPPILIFGVDDASP